jgi:glycerate 2-kinase
MEYVSAHERLSRDRRPRRIRPIADRFAGGLEYVRSMTAPHVVIAPDKFKGSLTGPQVAGHIAAGLRRVRPGTPLVSMPVADGGDGTVEAAVACGFDRREIDVAGPTGDRVTAGYAVRGDTAIVELAEASGLHRLPGGVKAPLTASSFGTGEVIDDAIRAGARLIVLGLGGSACTDGGAGMAAALGARLLDGAGAELASGGGALRELRSVDASEVSQRLRGITVIVAGDVDNPLLGRSGAAAVYGPQKGAVTREIRCLEAGLSTLDAVVRRDLGVEAATVPGAGAAGGVGFGAMAFLNAELKPGIAYLLDLLGFADALHGARLVITGEGSLDRQTLRGKAPMGVARAAVRADVPVIAVAGRRSLTGEQLRRARFAQAYALTDIEPDPERCMSEAGPLLERLAAQIADAWLAEPVAQRSRA